MKHSWENKVKSFNVKAHNPRNCVLILKVCICRGCGLVRVLSIKDGNTLTEYLGADSIQTSAGDCKPKED